MPLPKLRKPRSKQRCRAHVSDTISTLMHEDRPQDQAVAIALEHARRQGCRIPDTRGRAAGRKKKSPTREDALAERLKAHKRHNEVVARIDDIRTLHDGYEGRFAGELGDLESEEYGLRAYLEAEDSGHAAGKTPRPPKGTPTHLNLFTLHKELEAHAERYGRPEPLFAFSPTSMSGLRRLADAGYIVMQGQKGHWYLSALGRDAYEEWKQGVAGSYGVPPDYKRGDGDALLFKAKPSNDGNVAGRLTAREREALAYVAASKNVGVWTATMTDEFFQDVSRLVDKKLVVLVPRVSRSGMQKGSDAKVTSSGLALLAGRASGKVSNARYGQEPTRFEATSKPALSRIDRGGFLAPAGPDRFVLEDDSCTALHRFQARHGIPEGTVCAKDGLGHASGRAGAGKPVLLAREVRASALLPPHEVSTYYSNTQLHKLGVAYRRFDPVNPVVVIARKDRKYVGLVGSHRIHALKRVFGIGVVPTKYLLVISEDTARRAFVSRPGLVKVLERYLREQLTDEFPLGGYTELVHEIAKLSPELNDALSDQTPWATTPG